MDAERIQPYWHSIGALGIIGAKGNNGVGVTGINWDVSLMLLKIGAQGLRRGEPDVKRASRAARAIRFAADHGARVVNWSGWVDDPRPEATAELRDAVRYAATHGALLVLAAGNEALDLDRDENCRVLPQCLDEPNLLNVADLGSDGSLHRYTLEGRTFGSNFGVRRVEIGAFGGQFTTGLRHGFSTYERTGGTSSAAPVVSGVAALVLSVQPNLSATDLKRVLLDSATQVPTLASAVSGGRAVNAVAAVNLAKEWRVR
jgi:subtilisin family serine protease